MIPDDPLASGWMRNTCTSSSGEASATDGAPALSPALDAGADAAPNVVLVTGPDIGCTGARPLVFGRCRADETDHE